MTTILFYDTETSGLPLFHEPSEHPDQPHIVQLGACLVDADTRRVISTIDLIVRPDGWEIPDEVAAVHGITTEYAQAVGVDEATAVQALLDLERAAGYRVAHNESFDARILRIACMRFQGAEVADAWKARASKCTAQLSTPILALPPTDRMRAGGRTHHKTPNLGEAYRFFTGQPLVGAHSAMVDVRACMDVFFAIEARSAQQMEGARCEDQSHHH